MQHDVASAHFAARHHEYAQPLRRGNGHVSAAVDEALLAEGDTLVLSGHPAALALAEDKLLKG